MTFFKSKFKFFTKIFRIQSNCFREVREVCSEKLPTVFSAIQPTGIPHLGNYFGVIKRWVALQDEKYNCIYSIASLHSLNQPQDPKKLRENILSMTASLLACGIDPEKSTFFLQSDVPQHSELATILECKTTMAKLSHLPQYKEKSVSPENIKVGLFTYPVLQSADIMLYKASVVPVGEDQLQHIQLTQHLVKIFNNEYKKIFPEPAPLIDTKCARIKSLKQPDKKMSKSDLDFKSRIDLTDPPDIIVKRIKGAFTDFTSAVTYDPENRQGVSNLILIHNLCTGKSYETICEESRHLDTGGYKLVVAEALVEYLKPIQKQIEEYRSDRSYIASVLKKGAERANEIASRTIAEVKKAIGLTI